MKNFFSSVAFVLFIGFFSDVRESLYHGELKRYRGEKNKMLAFSCDEATLYGTSLVSPLQSVVPSVSNASFAFILGLMTRVRCAGELTLQTNHKFQRPTMCSVLSRYTI